MASTVAIARHHDLSMVEHLPEPERWLRRRVGLAWSLLIVNVLTFYPVDLERAAAGHSHPLGTGQAGHPGGAANRPAGRCVGEPAAGDPPERVSLPAEPAGRRRFRRDARARPHRHHLPHVQVRRLRRHAVAAHALLGATGPAARPLLSDIDHRGDRHRAAWRPGGAGNGLLPGQAGRCALAVPADASRALRRGGDRNDHLALAVRPGLWTAVPDRRRHRRPRPAGDPYQNRPGRHARGNPGGRTQPVHGQGQSPQAIRQRQPYPVDRRYHLVRVHHDLARQRRELKSAG